VVGVCGGSSTWVQGYPSSMAPLSSTETVLTSDPEEQATITVAATTPATTSQ
jgi:hypothetical protein